MAALQIKQKGLGLIELMISITLGLFLISGAIGVLVSSKVSYNLNKELTWIQDNARFATRILNRDVRMAGFTGCSRRQGFSSTLNPVSSGTGWFIDFENAIRGWDGAASDYPTPEFPAAFTSSTVAGLPDSDLMSIRHADGTEVAVADNIPTTSASIDIIGMHDFVDGDILVITDCEQTTVLQVTGNNPTRLVHNTGTGTPGNCSVFLGHLNCSSHSDNRREFRAEDGAFIMQMQAHAYYVSAAADGTPTLYRRKLVATGGNPALEDEELVQGVENFQVTYGFDADGDGYANRYVNANDVAAGDWVNVVTARMHLLFRSFSQVTSEPQSFRFMGTNYTPTDRYMRQEFISTVELRNKG